MTFKPKDCLDPNTHIPYSKYPKPLEIILKTLRFQIKGQRVFFISAVLLRPPLYKWKSRATKLRTQMITQRPCCIICTHASCVSLAARVQLVVQTKCATFETPNDCSRMCCPRFTLSTAYSMEHCLSPVATFALARPVLREPRLLLCCFFFFGIQSMQKH